MPVSVRENVKNDVMYFMQLHRALVGSVLATQSFSERTFGYNVEERGEVAQALIELVEEGLLEEREGQFYLTQKGSHFLYK